MIWWQLLVALLWITVVQYLRTRTAIRASAGMILLMNERLKEIRDEINREI